MLTHWWLAQTPPLPGLLRFVFYAGLLALCLADHPSPMDAPRLVAKTERRFYTPALALRALGISWVEPPMLRVVRALTIAAWVCAAVGLLQPVTGILTFLGFAFLHAVNSGLLGSNHSTHSALYALFCLCFSVSYDGPTLDRILAEHTSWPLPAHPGSALESGFAPTLLLVALSYVMLAGGVSKLRNGGSAWLDGKGLRFYLVESAEYARAPFVSRAFIARPGLCRLLAGFSVLVEVSAPFALLVPPPYRLIFVLAWSGLHIGILLVMMPAYWVQMWCYLLVLDWYQIAGFALGRHLQAVPGPDLHSASAYAFSGFGLAFCLTLLVVLVRQIEQWPFTAVPMYSNGVAPADLTPPDRGELHGRAVRALRGHTSAWPRPWVSAEIQDDVRLVPRDGGAPVPLFDEVAELDVKFVRWSQYAKVVRGVTIEDVAAKPADRPDLTGPQFPAGRFLAGLADLVREGLPDWPRYARIELVCHTRQGWLPVGCADLDEEGPSRTTGTRVSTVTSQARPTSGRTDS
ncbi:MAG TPA: hypothetical protein VGX23_25890 [Actinocrinis sp.]|nr:hypothetical protein [Actinocrinis sp.]